MLLKKYVIPMLVSAVIFAGTAAGCPVYAQDGSTESGNGFFGGIGRFFSNMWGGESKSQPAKQPQQMQPTNNKLKPTGETQPAMAPKEGTKSGQFIPGEEGRLNALVAQGKITEAQKTAILAKFKQIQEELKTWAASEGIDPQYVMLAGPMQKMPTSIEGSPSGKPKPVMIKQGSEEKMENRGKNQKMMQPGSQPQKQY